MSTLIVILVIIIPAIILIKHRIWIAMHGYRRPSLVHCSKKDGDEIINRFRNWLTLVNTCSEFDTKNDTELHHYSDVFGRPVLIKLDNGGKEEYFVEDVWLTELYGRYR